MIMASASSSEFEGNQERFELPCLQVQEDVNFISAYEPRDPSGFSGSGIWLTSRPGFGILQRQGYEIRDCNYDRDTGFPL